MPWSSASWAAATSVASSAPTPVVPSSRPPSWTMSVGRRRAPRRPAGAARTRLAARRRQRRDDRSPARSTIGRRRLCLGSHQRLDEHVDRAAARQADVPGLLVADPVADHPGVAVATGALDLLERRAFDAAAADDPASRSSSLHQQNRALRPRRGPERPDDHGTGRRVPLRLPGRSACRAVPSSGGLLRRQWARRCAGRSSSQWTSDGRDRRRLPPAPDARDRASGFGRRFRGPGAEALPCARIGGHATVAV